MKTATGDVDNDDDVDKGDDDDDDDDVGYMDPWIQDVWNSSFDNVGIADSQDVRMLGSCSLRLGSVKTSESRRSSQSCTNIISMQMHKYRY